MSLTILEKTGNILALEERPTKLVQLKSRDETIVCSAINSQGTWIAYSDQQRIRMFNLQLVSIFLDDTIQFTRTYFHLISTVNLNS